MNVGCRQCARCSTKQRNIGHVLARRHRCRYTRINTSSAAKHTRALYAIGFHPDGSLVASAGLDAVVRLWDVRTGRAVQAFQGHVKQVLGLDFHPLGTTLASGSDDHTVRLWDLRKKKALYTLPAHSSLISHVRYEPGAGSFLLSTSYDNLIKLWSTRDYALLQTMEGHEGRVMCGDIADDGIHFASAAMDRTWKLWA